MLESVTTLEPHYQWLILATILGICEIFVPGVFLIWFAAAATVTGFATYIFGFSVAVQFLFFAAMSLAAVYLGRRWYLSNDVESSDPLLNDRGSRMIGKIVTIVEPVSATSGRAKVADGVWPARGPDMKKGDTAKIVAVTDGVLELEAS